MTEILESNPELFPIFFIGMWVFVLLLLSRMGGWSRLAEYYSSNSDFSGEKWLTQSIKLGIVNYGSCVTIGANSNSMYLSVLFPFRVGHPKLEIPFSDISGKEHKGFVFKYVDIFPKKAPGTKIRLFKKQADRLENTSNGNWQYERP